MIRGIGEGVVACMIFIALAVGVLVAGITSLIWWLLG